MTPSNLVIRPDFAREWGTAVVELCKVTPANSSDDGFRLKEIKAIFYGKQQKSMAKLFLKQCLK